MIGLDLLDLMVELGICLYGMIIIIMTILDVLGRWNFPSQLREGKTPRITKGIYEAPYS